MDKKTTILLGLGGAALIGGIIYYFRAKKLQTDVISALKTDLQSAGIQLPIRTPTNSTQIPRPVQRPITTPTRPISTRFPTQSGQSQGNEVRPPRFGEYGQQSQTYGQNQTQIGQDFGQGQYGGGLIYDTGEGGYGGNTLYDTGATGYGGNVLYDTGGNGYGGKKYLTLEAVNMGG